MVADRRLLAAKAVALTGQPLAPDDLRYLICAREQVDHAAPDTMVVTAEDVFA